MVDQGWGFVRSLYFSVAAMSTAGLQAPNIRGDGSGLGDDFSAYFVALFCLLGVPLFGVAMGLIANIFVDSLVQARVSLQQDLSDEEFNRVAGLSIDDGTVQFGEFFILELLRQGKVDMDGVHAIKRAYDQIDANGDGTLSAHEVRRFHKICALRHRYAQFLASQKKMQHDFAIAVVIEMDTRALVQKSLELKWLAPAADVVLDVGSAEAV
jgi:Ca2+-binding EF-hand superfamily protein